MTACATRPGSSTTSVKTFYGPLLAAALLTILGLRVAQLIRAPAALDELEHIHGAFLVSRGQVPYRDFFQHHPPLYYLLLGRGPFFSAPGWSSLLWVRAVALIFSFGTLALVFVWGRIAAGRKVAALAVAVVAADYFFARHGARAYLDTFAAPLVLGGAILLTKPRRTLWSSAGAGALFMAALLTTQKLVILGVPLLVWFVSELRRRKVTVSYLLAFAGGGLIVAAGVAVALGPVGVRGFVREAVTLNLRWKARHRPIGELRNLLITGPVVYLLALAGVVRSVVRVVRRRGLVEVSEMPALFLAAYAIGTVVVPVVYAEYFVSPVPVAGLVAAMAIAGLLERQLAHRRLFVSVLGAAVIALPLAIQVQSLQASNRAQRDRIAFVAAIAGQDEPVFDTYAGYGLFRPHAYRYWLLHDELQLMLDPTEVETEVLRVLDEKRPPVVVEDRFSATLPAAVREDVNRRYRKSRFDDVWCRADLAPRCGAPADSESFGELSG